MSEFTEWDNYFQERHGETVPPSKHIQDEQLLKYCASYGYTNEQKQSIYGNTNYTSFDNFWSSVLDTEVSCCKKFVEIYGLESLYKSDPYFSGIGLGAYGGYSVTLDSNTYYYALSKSSIFVLH